MRGSNASWRSCFLFMLSPPTAPQCEGREGVLGAQGQLMVLSGRRSHRRGTLAVREVHGTVWRYVNTCGRLYIVAVLATPGRNHPRMIGSGYGERYPAPIFTPGALPDPHLGRRSPAWTLALPGFRPPNTPDAIAIHVIFYIEVLERRTLDVSKIQRFTCRGKVNHSNAGRSDGDERVSPE